MPKVSEMSADERNDLVKKLAGAVKEAGLADKVKIQTYRESVAPLAAAEVMDSFSIKVSAKLGPEFKDKVDALKTTCEPILEGVEGATFDVTVALGPGCKYDPIKDLKPIKGGDAVTLEHKEGEVWMIDFWATWCPPCQAPMAHNQAMLDKRGAEWGDKVKIICISIDQTADKVVSHCDAKGWNSPIHYHRAESDCSKQYSVSGVPNVMIVDTNGMIVFKGHPANRPDLEADFDNLLKGEKLTGAGTEPEGAGGDDGKEAAGKDLNSADCLAVIDTFVKETGPALQKSLKEHATKCPKAFCVMTYTENYDINTEKSKIDWKNYRVLIGPQDAIDECKKQIEENVKGDFEVVPQIRAM
jgi:thiol-disulfide isomerase/thioredoxin